MNTENKPCADYGLTSYRYKGQYGWIMIGAKNTDDALTEAARSVRYPVTVVNLEIYTDNGYKPL